MSPDSYAGRLFHQTFRLLDQPVYGVAFHALGRLFDARGDLVEDFDLLLCFGQMGLNQRFEVRILGCGRDLWQRFGQRVFRVSDVLQGVMKNVSEGLHDLVLF